MTRPVTEQGLNQQIALMTGEMFAAVRSGDKQLFDLTIAKGADVHAFNADGFPLFHAGIRRAISEQNFNWLLHVLPHVDDLFVKNSKGRTLFDDKIDDQLLPYRGDEYIAMLRKIRVRVMQEMPDIQTARERLNPPSEALSEKRVLVAPRFNVVTAPERIEKPTHDDGAPSPRKPAAPAP